VRFRTPDACAEITNQPVLRTNRPPEMKAVAVAAQARLG
jgi:hypothetical protein